MVVLGKGKLARNQRGCSAMAARDDARVRRVLWEVVRASAAPTIVSQCALSLAAARAPVAAACASARGSFRSSPYAVRATF